jgi:hypothetical protein
MSKPSFPVLPPSFDEPLPITKEGKYITFLEGPSKEKTKVWFVVNKYEDFHLGWVAWFPAWRKYSFYPKAETVYEEVCLRDIANFCVSQTKIHKESK